MEKLRMTSKGIVSSNVAKIAMLFPNCVTERQTIEGNTETVVDFDMLRQELSNEVVEGPAERYQFTWPDKRASINTANQPTTMTLRPCKEESVGKDGTQGLFNSENLYIEGDNLEVLKVLRETYLGKVKMIYIDPPYNTGNDFVYNDNFASSYEEFAESCKVRDEEGNLTFDPKANGESNGRFHTDWLNMIYPRLKVARDLLSDDGVIFISIDNNEVENLVKVCDEIFGSQNHIETIVWKNKYGAGAKTVGFISVHEYILCYSKKSISNITSELDEEGQSVYNKRDEKYATRGGYMTQPLMTNSLGDRPNLMYPIEYEGHVIYPKKQWVWSKERLLNAINNNEVEFNQQSDGSFSVRSKAYLKDEEGRMRRGKPLSLMNGPFNQDGTKDIRDLFDGKSIFDFTKPCSLISKLLSYQINDCADNDFIVLDFFSGSATTAQAVMKLNLEDGGKRKFIMIQLPEVTDEKSEARKNGYNNICEIGKERIRRAGKQILSSIKPSAVGLFDEAKEIAKPDVGFRVLKLAESNMEDVFYSPDKFEANNLFTLVDNVKQDRTSLDLLYQVMLELGIELSSSIEKKTIDGIEVFDVRGGFLIATFDKDINEETITEIAKKEPVYFVMRDASASNDNVLDNFDQLFRHYSPDTIRRIL
jgi:adenine-specific DNA-methyltransferase